MEIKKKAAGITGLKRNPTKIVPFEAAIFDVDGTLLDSMPVWTHLGSRYLKTLSVAPAQDLDRILFPMTLTEGVQYLKKQYHLRQSEQEIRRGLQNMLEQFYRKEVALKKGAARFVKFLAGQKVPMVLATTGDPVLEEAALKRLGIWHYFQKLFVCDAYQTAKTEPEIYEICAGYLGYAPTRILVIEDTLQAVRTASQAGFQTAAIRDAASAGDEEKIRETADYYAEDFASLQDLF